MERRSFSSPSRRLERRRVPAVNRGSGRRVVLVGQATVRSRPGNAEGSLEPQPAPKGNAAAKLGLRAAGPIGGHRSRASRKAASAAMAAKGVRADARVFCLTPARL